MGSGAGAGGGGGGTGSGAGGGGAGGVASRTMVEVSMRPSSGTCLREPKSDIKIRIKKPGSFGIRAGSMRFGSGAQLDGAARSASIEWMARGRSGGDAGMTGAGGVYARIGSGVGRTTGSGGGAGGGGTGRGAGGAGGGADSTRAGLGASTGADSRGVGVEVACGCFPESAARSDAYVRITRSGGAPAGSAIRPSAPSVIIFGFWSSAMVQVQDSFYPTARVLLIKTNTPPPRRRRVRHARLLARADEEALRILAHVGKRVRGFFQFPRRRLPERDHLGLYAVHIKEFDKWYEVTIASREDYRIELV